MKEKKYFLKSSTILTNSVFAILAVIAGLFGSADFFNALVAALQDAGMNVDLGGLTLVITFIVSAINIALRFKTDVGVTVHK